MKTARPTFRTDNEMKAMVMLREGGRMHVQFVHRDSDQFCLVGPRCVADKETPFKVH